METCIPSSNPEYVQKIASATYNPNMDTTINNDHNTMDNTFVEGYCDSSFAGSELVQNMEHSFNDPNMEIHCNNHSVDFGSTSCNPDYLEQILHTFELQDDNEFGSASCEDFEQMLYSYNLHDDSKIDANVMAEFAQVFGMPFWTVHAITYIKIEDGHFEMLNVTDEIHYGDEFENIYTYSLATKTWLPKNARATDTLRQQAKQNALRASQLHENILKPTNIAAESFVSYDIRNCGCSNPKMLISNDGNRHQRCMNCGFVWHVDSNTFELRAEPPNLNQFVSPWQQASMSPQLGEQKQ